MNYNAFEGIKSLYGESAFNTLINGHYLVIGLGGVGSWICEALARSGVQNITIVDLDDICVSNINRQIHATSKTLGQFKVDVMRERLEDINPNIFIRSIQDYYNQKTSDSILDQSYDYVFDAIDSTDAKSHLIYQCRNKDLKIITIGAAAGLRDPSKIVISDLNRTTQDRMLHRVRKILKKDYRFPKYTNKKFHVPAVYSTEELIPRIENKDSQITEGANCNKGLGSTSFVTASFGFMAVSYVFEKLSAPKL
jgi:tRNA A37 threonylcarbamoyladenosine dehydratase